MAGLIEAIFIAPEAGVSMQSVSEARLINPTDSIGGT